MQAALEALGQEIDSSPRLVVRTGELDDANRARIERLCADAGFSGDATGTCTAHVFRIHER